VAGQGNPPALAVSGLAKRFGGKIAVNGIQLVVPAGSFYGLVGPNGAGKTTTLSMATGLLRPDAGSVQVHGVDVWQHQLEAKRLMGILPDGVRLFDRLSGEQLVTYAGLLRGMDRETVAGRVRDLLQALDLTQDAGTLVVDYSAGMTKKIALASALIHVAVIAQGNVLAAGTVDEVRGGASLEDRFVELVGGRNQTEGLEWLRTF
jgi:ABC-2 type transport system ATP-binding protein